MNEIKQLKYEISEMEKNIVLKKSRGSDTKFEESLVKAWKKVLRKLIETPSDSVRAKSDGLKE